MVNFGALATEIGWQRKSTKLYTMFGCLRGWYTIFFLGGGLLSPNGIHFTSKSCVLLYWQRYCTALKQWPSAKLCVVVQRVELRNFLVIFNRGRHLYSEGGHHVGHRPTFYTVSQKKGASLTMAITLSILDGFAKFFHFCKEQ